MERLADLNRSCQLAWSDWSRSPPDTPGTIEWTRWPFYSPRWFELLGAGPGKVRVENQRYVTMTQSMDQSQAIGTRRRTSSSESRTPSEKRDEASLGQRESPLPLRIRHQ